MKQYYLIVSSVEKIQEESKSRTDKKWENDAFIELFYLRK